jgi:hypothetical protein
MQGYSSNKRNGNQSIEQHQPNFEQNNTLADLNPMPTHPPMYQPFQPNPYAQQNIPHFQPDPYAQQNAQNQQINMAVQQSFGGFGQYYFNAMDPNIAKTNIPQKQ